MIPPGYDTDVPGHVRVGVAADQLRLTIREVYDLIDQGAVPAVRDGRRQIVVPADALARLRDES